MKICSACGENKPIDSFYKRKNRPKGCVSECKSCFKERMGNRHQEHKDTLTEEFGGKCQRCGYDICQRILHFHHIDSTTKTFEISDRLSSSLDVLRLEARKCVLLCPNCHMEKHQGIW